MENFQDSKPDLLSSGSLEIDEQSGSYLKDAGLWAKAIAVIASIVGGLAVIGALVFTTSLGSANSYFGQGYYIGIVVTIIIVMLIALIGIINLFRFSNGMATGISNQDANAFDKGISGLKTYFILIGVLTLLITFLTLIQLIS